MKFIPITPILFAAALLCGCTMVPSGPTANAAQRPIWQPAQQGQYVAQSQMPQASNQTQTGSDEVPCTQVSNTEAVPGRYPEKGPVGMCNLDKFAWGAELRAERARRAQLAQSEQTAPTPPAQQYTNREPGPSYASPPASGDINVASSSEPLTLGPERIKRINLPFNASRPLKDGDRYWCDPTTEDYVPNKVNSCTYVRERMATATVAKCCNTTQQPVAPPALRSPSPPPALRQPCDECGGSSTYSAPGGISISGVHGRGNVVVIAPNLTGEQIQQLLHMSPDKPNAPNVIITPEAPVVGEPKQKGS